MNILKISVIILIIVFLNAIFWGCGSKNKSDTHNNVENNSTKDEHTEDEHSDEIIIKPEGLAEVDFEVVPIRKQAFQQVRTYPGIVAPSPDGDAHVGSLISGRVVTIDVRLGKKVKIGTPLCRIESPEIGAAQAAYIRAAAEYELAKKEQTRSQKLKEADIGSEKNLLEKEAALQSAQAEFEAAERGLISIGFSQTEIATMKNDKDCACILTIKSPIDGTVTDWWIKIGQRVDPEKDLFHILDLTKLWIQIAVYEKDLPGIKISQIVNIVPQSFPDKIFQGKIVQIGREVNKETRTINCFAEVPNEGEILIPNLFVTCQIMTDTANDHVLSVPEDAIVIDEHGDQSVYLEVEPFHFAVREVKTDRTSNGWVEILDGLKEGDRVVFKGAFFIKSEVAKGNFGHGHAH